MGNEITIKDLAERVVFFTDAYWPNEDFDDKSKEKFKAIADDFLTKTEDFDNFDTRYVRKNKARFFYERAGFAEESLKLASELVKDFENKYPSPLHYIWAHYIDSAEHLLREGTPEVKEENKNKLIKIYSELSQSVLPPSLSSNIWLRAPFRKVMLDGNKEEFLNHDFSKYVSHLKSGEIDFNCMLYDVKDEINRTFARTKEILPVFYYLEENKSKLDK